MKDRTYTSWCGMKYRCYNKNSHKYQNYGGRGIEVCERWRNSFDNFLQDMGERPDGMSLDRIDVNGNYTPENCRWATNIEQQNNKRNSVYLTKDGETLTTEEWARRLGILPTTFRKRLLHNHSNPFYVGDRPAVNTDASGIPRPHANNASGYRGVSKIWNRWRAQIKVNGKKIYLGAFDTPEEAHEVYLRARKEFWG